MAHFNFVISQNAKWGHAGFYIDCHRMTVPENILLQKSTAGKTVTYLIILYAARSTVILSSPAPHTNGENF